jgi:lysophospholipase L1-like esterase
VADPRLGSAGREADRASFADRVHLTDAGYRIVAGLVADQIKALQDR